MPPLRRYLRITPHSVLEVRIYLDNPADAQRWLLNARSPVLPRVVQAVRPYVIPKLREENARAKAGKKKKIAEKSVVHGEDFEVVIFLTATSARHSILKKEKRVKGEKGRLGITDGKMTGVGTREAPVEVGGDDGAVVREESLEGKDTSLDDVPQAEDTALEGDAREARDESKGLFVSESSEDGNSPRPSRKGKHKEAPGQEVDADDKKKMALNTSYDGFSIYGRILCLIVKRKGDAKGKEIAGSTGQAMMEDWISSTQMAEGQMMDD